MVIGMSAADLQCLLQCGKGLDGVYIHDPVAKTALVPAANEIPWPIEFILGHHQKHVFMNRRLPGMGKVGKALDVWANSLRWRAFFHLKS